MSYKKITFRTLTPIWTGGADQKSNEIHETGIIGSFRWWYELIIRGLGGYACDPTQNNSCRFRADEYQKGLLEHTAENKVLEKAGLCPVCQFFGATGWQRRFRLEIKDLSPQPLQFKASSGVYVPAGNWLWRMFGGDKMNGKKEGRGANVKFDFGEQYMLWGRQSSLKFIPLSFESEEIWAKFAFLVHTIANLSGIGAKTQLGFGQIEILNGVLPSDISIGLELISNELKNSRDHHKNDQIDFVKFHQCFSQVYQLKNPKPYINQLKTIGNGNPEGCGSDYIPCAFDIKYKSEQKNPFTGQGRNFGLRPWFRHRWGAETAHLLFGRSDAKSDKERVAGRIGLSHLYRNEQNEPWKLKVWGFVPSGITSQDGKRKGVQGVSEEIDEFIKGPNGMFPGSQVEKIQTERIIK